MAEDRCGREVRNWCFTRGDNVAIKATLTDNADDSAIDLTGCTVVLTVNSDIFPDDDTNEVFVLTGDIQSPPTDGIVHFQPTTTQANQTPGVYFYDIQVTFLDGSRLTVATGEWEYDGQDISDPAEN